MVQEILPDSQNNILHLDTLIVEKGTFTAADVAARNLHDDLKSSLDYTIKELLKVKQAVKPKQYEEFLKQMNADISPFLPGVTIDGVEEIEGKQVLAAHDNETKIERYFSSDAEPLRKLSDDRMETSIVNGVAITTNIINGRVAQQTQEQNGITTTKILYAGNRLQQIEARSDGLGGTIEVSKGTGPLDTYVRHTWPDLGVLMQFPDGRGYTFKPDGIGGAKEHRWGPNFRDNYDSEIRDGWERKVYSDGSWVETTNGKVVKASKAR